MLMAMNVDMIVAEVNYSSDITKWELLALNATDDRIGYIIAVEANDRRCLLSLLAQSLDLNTFSEFVVEVNH